MKSVKIKGKDYVEVNERVKHFRENYEDWALLSDVVFIEGDKVVIKAEVVNPEGVVKATGIASEIEGSTFINKTSYIENCETSAWGRALGNFGIGIDASIASAQEVENAIENQKPKKKSKPKPEKTINADEITVINDLIKEKGIDKDEFLKYLKSKIGVDKIENIPQTYNAKIVGILDKK